MIIMSLTGIITINYYNRNYIEYISHPTYIITTRIILLKAGVVFIIAVLKLNYSSILKDENF